MLPEQPAPTPPEFDRALFRSIDGDSRLESPPKAAALLGEEVRESLALRNREGGRPPPAPNKEDWPSSDESGAEDIPLEKKEFIGSEAGDSVINRGRFFACIDSDWSCCCSCSCCIRCLICAISKAWMGSLLLLPAPFLSEAPASSMGESRGAELRVEF